MQTIQRPWRRRLGAVLIGIGLGGCTTMDPKLAGPADPPSAPPPAVSAVAADSVLRLEVDHLGVARTVGTAVVVAPSVLVTNRHVLDAAGGREIRAVRSNGTAVRVSELGRSTVADLAFLRADTAAALPVAPQAQPTQATWLVGASAGTMHVEPAAMLRAQARLPAFGNGFIMQARHAAQGFSGGPALDDRGRLVGLIAAGCAIREPGDGPAVARLAAGLPGPAPACLRNVFVIGALTVEIELRRLTGGTSSAGVPTSPDRII